MAACRRRELDVTLQVAADLGMSAVEAIASGYYVSGSGRIIDWCGDVQAACNAKVSIPPDDPLPAHGSIDFPETRVQDNHGCLAKTR